MLRHNFQNSAYFLAVPLRPQNVFITSISNTSATLRWKQPLYAGMGITKYKVSSQFLRITNTSALWPIRYAVYDEAKLSRDGDFYTVTLTGLTPYSMYTFKVFAIAGQFEGRSGRVRGNTSTGGQ